MFVGTVYQANESNFENIFYQAGDMNITVGDLVKFKRGLYQEEEGLIYLVLEVNDDRSIIEWVNTKMTIRPTSLARVADLEVYIWPTSMKFVQSFLGKICSDADFLENTDSITVTR